MRIKVEHHIGDLYDDMVRIVTTAPLDLEDVVRSNAYQGNRIARDFAKQSAGKHGKLYPNAFSTERNGLHSWEYGPDAAKPQGAMSFERGSRNQPYHGDLAKSADLIGPKFAHDVGEVIDGLFW
ncbi:hypothetical protein FB382_004392 [Nocardioides ginsengisegetis]|uniref:Uncharacterized protein n=1 Tax=Nocardioides ginsengisegetis TaxID=661491 RepID=A0A7W3J4A0_9ACTN|nr:hypothetical protein [Nocardioides ginsengisegetis]MBA8806041.1 hypothetical protein [Nocardioides ginsengisegetis]